jgi:hypothetical protein
MSGLRGSCTAALGPFDAESSRVAYPEEFWHNRAAINIVRQPEEKTASLGFEPRQRDPESLVLPLHHEATSEKSKTDFRCCKSSAVALARDSSGCGFCAEQDLSAFASRFDF